MIQITDCSKNYDDIQAVSHVSLELRDGEVFGLLGSNGAGKSTLMRMMAGIMKPDGGQILIDGEPVYENDLLKQNIFFCPDGTYYPVSAAAKDLAAFYKCYYPTFDTERFHKLMKQLQLDEDRKISTFSKGMKKQLSIILGISAGTKYLFCDETFDGLDPVMRQAVKSLFADEMLNRGFTPVIASHNLRELEDICDHVGLLHKGGILLSRNLDDMKFHIHKVQCVLKDDAQIEELRKDLDILKVSSQGSLRLLTVRGTRNEVLQRIQAMEPLFCEVVPLSLEEIFISETEVAGYEIQSLLF
ncbi:MAG: ABC transporter ATP-binding protein [Clostridiales bacterium]|nr:ABC transporter ATP-binding protein [Candidatus Blautia equi]